MSEHVGPYRVLETIGEGSFGELFRGEGPDGEAVVIKRLKVDHLLDDKALDLFRREGGVLRSLRHRSVPRFHEVGVDDDGMPFLVQELIEGQTLEQAVKAGQRFDTAAAHQLTRDLLEALDYLHGLHPPVIHRDLKPANILLRDGRPIIIDFGAVAGHALLQDETSDTVVGTFGYMAPEMLKGRASPASDLYALGATLLFAFSGRQPESFPTRRLRIQFRDVITLPAPLADLIESLLEPAAEDRPQSAAEALGQLDSSDQLPAKRDQGPVSKLPSGRRKVIKYAAGGLGIAALTALIILGPPAFVAMLKTAAIVGVVIIVVFAILLVVSGAF